MLSKAAADVNQFLTVTVVSLRRATEKVLWHS
jgi:hypothetical protein